MLLLLFIVCGVQATTNTVIYDAYYGSPASKEDIKRFEDLNNTFWCVDEIVLPCDPAEGRRLDGTCNNLKYPIRGATHTPFSRVLPAEFGPGFEIRKTKSGKPPRLPRKLRTGVLSEGSVNSQVFTHLTTHFLLFSIIDSVSFHDTVSLVVWTSCCTENGKSDDKCRPILIPDDDPVFRFTNIRCLNDTDPITYQNMGCLRNPNSTPSRISSSTPFLDLNPVYGNTEGLKKSRLFQGGLLKYEVDEGRFWPPSFKDGQGPCLLNQPPRETRCHDTTDAASNALFGINIMYIWVWRFHNYIATELAKVNPCWDDETLFNTAADINIAVLTQILYYESLPSLMGWDNLVRDGVISDSTGFRDEYDENVIPQTFLEFPFIGRWVHTMQHGMVQFYDDQGHYLKEYPIVNLTVRTGFLAVDDNIDSLTQGTFRGPSADIDYVVDNWLAESALGPLQKAADVMSSDLSKNRLFGFPSYIKYRNFCSGTNHASFDDLADYMDPKTLELLKYHYESVEDIDLLVGTWLERPIEGGYVPPTFYCLMTQQYLQNIKFDRHWYERPNRVNAFTNAQLLEIRKSTIAQLVCTVGDKVTEIQPNAFYRESNDNPMTSCGNIPSINFEAWRDDRCSEDISCDWEV